MSDVNIGPSEPIVSHHFKDRDQQTETSHIGMWLFLAQEVMFFGGLFAAYFYYRTLYPEVFRDCSGFLDYKIGGFNTIVLLLSSVTMATCVFFTQTGKWKQQLFFLISTIALGFTFLFVKYFEWKAKWDGGMIPHIRWDTDMQLGHGYALLDPVKSELFYSLYFIMTGMHAFHMIIGFAIGACFIYLCAIKKEYGPNKYLPIEYFGLYWHFVDIVWVFLFPMLYLI
jgi:cytochrome c oxidase subunit 3